jgi:hypothetical protein
LPHAGAPPRNQNARRHGGYSKTRTSDSTDAARGPVATGGATDPPVAPLSAQVSDPAPASEIPTLETIIKDLWDRQQELMRNVDQLRRTRYADPSRLTTTGLLSIQIAAQSLYRQNAATLGRLIKYLDELKQGGGDTTQAGEAMGHALDAMAKELGLKL